jgi:anti-sigma-K factor RskA
MGSDSDKPNKAEKKRLKAQYKHDKKQAKLDAEQRSAPPPVAGGVDASQSGANHTRQKGAGKVPWYKNPDWIRAIAATASLAVAVIVAIITLL